MANTKYACISLDLESDHAGRLPEQYDSWQWRHIEKLFKCLKKYKVSLSAFVVANTLYKNEEIIRYMQRQHTEFFLHSYSHDLKHPDSKEEIQNGVLEFQKFFHTRPMGYRAPEGRISKEGYRLLHENGFVFDSSVFPSFWPNPKYLLYSRSIHSGPYAITEIPISTVSPARIIFSLSWVQLLGWRIYKVLLDAFPLPNTVIFDFHLHDLQTVKSVQLLSPFWRYIYQKKQGSQLALLEDILSYLQEKNYTFVPMSELVLHKKI